jgi:hypothetical protein
MLKRKNPKLSRYLDGEAAHSGDDTSCGSSSQEDESDDSMVCGDDEVEYEDGANSEENRPSEKEFKKQRKLLDAKRARISKSFESEEAEALNQKNEVISAELKKAELIKKIIEKDSKSKDVKKLASPDLKISDNEEQPKPTKLTSNKMHSEADIPPKPASLGLGRKKNTGLKKFTFRVFFTNGAMFYKFLLPVANAVHELRFNLTSTPTFTGIRLEAHDTYLTLANKSRYECDIEGGFTLDGAPIGSEELTGMTFCVAASSFMHTLGCATLKDTVLTITKYCDTPDKVTFEALTNENDVQTVYSCDLLAESRLESLKGMSFSLGYHVNIYLKTLKEQTINAKKCGASTIFFALYQAVDVEDADVIHSRLSVGFSGTVTTGSHDFYQSARKIERDENGVKVTEFQALAGLTLSQRQNIDMARVSYNEYDNGKLRLFLSHMDLEWCLLHICNDGTQKPLVLECEIGGKNTKHTIIVAPKMDVS